MVNSSAFPGITAAHMFQSNTVTRAVREGPQRKKRKDGHDTMTNNQNYNNQNNNNRQNNNQNQNQRQNQYQF